MQSNATVYCFPKCATPSISNTNTEVISLQIDLTKSTSAMPKGQLLLKHRNRNHHYRKQYIWFPTNNSKATPPNSTMFPKTRNTKYLQYQYQYRSNFTPKSILSNQHQQSERTIVTKATSPPQPQPALPKSNIYDTATDNSKSNTTKLSNVNTNMIPN